MAAIERSGYDSAGARWLASVVHELRTPLASLQLASETLLEDLAEAEEETRRRMRQIQRSASWIQDLVDNLSSMLALDAGCLEWESAAVRLCECVHETITLLEPIHERAEQRVHVTCPSPSPVVQGDRMLIERVLTNLLGNAAKYSVRGDTIEVGVSVQGRCAQVRVTDHGPGIPLAEQERIFERYARGGGLASGVRGLGLGLAIARSLVELLGGSMGVDSRPGSGASFWFTLPMYERA